MSMQEKSQLNIKITPLELILNGITLILFISSIIYLVFIWGSLPSEVPAHYNASGEVDRWGSKWEMIILSIIIAILGVGMTVLEKYLHVYYRYQPKENLRSEYVNVRLMLNVVKNIIILIFVYLKWKSIQIALGNDLSLSSWFLPIALIFIFVPIIYFIIRSLRSEK